MEKNYFSLSEESLLPYALSNAETDELLLSIHEEATRKTLVNHNLRFVVYIAKQFENTDVSLDELISIGTIGLIKAVDTFRVEKKTKLATYANTCIENEILMHLRWESKWKNFSSLDKTLAFDDYGYPLTLYDLYSDKDSYSQFKVYENKELLAHVLTLASNLLSNRELFIFFSRIGKRRAIELEKELGISKRHVLRIQKNIHKEIEKKLKKKKLEIRGDEKYLFSVENELCISFSKSYFAQVPFNAFDLKYEDSGGNYTIVKLPVCDESFIVIAEIIKYNFL